MILRKYRKRGKWAWQNGRARRSSWGQTGPTVLAGNKKERALCQHAHQQSVMALMPTGRNCDHRKWQYVAATQTRAAMPEPYS